MKKISSLFFFSLLLLLFACNIPTSQEPKIETIWWEEDAGGYIQFYTNDPQHCGNSFIVWYDPNVDPANSIDVEVKKVSGHRYGGFGILFCLQNIDNYYLLEIDTEGYYTVYKNVSGTLSEIIDWTYTDKLKTGYNTINRLNVSYTYAVNTFTIKFNDTPVRTFVDESFSGGYSGFFADVVNEENERFPESPVDVRFKFKTISGIVVSPASGLVTTEEGGTDSFTVALNSQPSEDVTIGLLSGDPTEGTISPASLTFTPDNWSTPQTVTVSGMDDILADGNQAYTIITAPGLSFDAQYGGFDAADVSVVNKDNEIYKILSPYAESNASLGGSAAISGNYAIVGAAEEAEGGAAYIFYRIGTNIWDSGTKIIAQDTQSHDSFGCSVAISGDYAVVGAQYVDDGGVTAGAAYIFHRTGTNTWDFGIKLLPTDVQAGDQFGRSVAIDGDYAIVGSEREDEGGSDAGAAYVFHRTDTNTWDSGIKLMAPDAHGNQYFGCSVAISGDYAIVGALYDGEGGSLSGTAYIFHRTDINTWDSGVKIMAPDAQGGDYFGCSVAISGDYAIVGALNESEGGSRAGAAYVYYRTDINTWDSGTKVLAPDTQSYDEFGGSVGISGDYAIVGAQREEEGGDDAGAAYIFYRTDTNTWDSGTKILAPDAQHYDEFGSSVGMSGDYAIVGAKSEDEGGNDAGAAYIIY